MTLTGEELEQVQDAVELEGFDYAFMHWFNLEDFKDAELRRLAKAYRAAAEELAEYVGVEA